MLSSIKPHYLVIVVFLSSFVLDFLYKGSGLSDDLNVVLSVSSFIFGFYIILAVTRAKEKQDSIRRQLRLADGLFVSCNIEMKVFPEEIQKKFLKKVDNYLITTVDYKLSDIEKTSNSFYELYEYTTNSIKPNNDMQKNSIQRVCGSLYELTKERTLLEVLSKNKSSKLEWGLIISLFIVILFLIFNLNISGVFGSLFIATLVSSLSSILLILYRYDNLAWQESRWVWEPLTRTFMLLGLKPYYGEYLIKQKRFKIPKGIDYRLAHYPNPYPNMEGKVVEEIEAK
jgi:hypothetical protein